MTEEPEKNIENGFVERLRNSKSKTETQHPATSKKPKNLLRKAGETAFIVLGTILLLNITLTVIVDIRDALKPQHIKLADGPNMSPEVNAALGEMRNDNSFAYEAFVGWQAWQQNGQYINIDKDGIRRTVGQPAKARDEILLFGGSTMWGWGVDDANTIASQLQKLLPKRKVVNLGEVSYNATQGLNRLLLWLTQHPKQKGSVVSYDGINEILSSCSGINGPYGHAMVDEIRKAIALKRRGHVTALLDDLFLAQTRKLAEKVKGRLAPVEPRDCSNDPAYADAVARRLVTSWQAAAAIARSNGLSFVAILQPTPYSDPNMTPHLVEKEWKMGVEAVYPKVIELAKGYDWFVDGRSWFEGRDVYVDACCHVNGKSNAELAAQIARLLPAQN